MIYRAHYLLTMVEEPILDGEVLVRGGRIEAVGPNLSLAYPDEHVTDFGHAAILPGFVNLHTHLDWTLARGLLDGLEFFPWVRKLAQLGGILDYDDFLASARLGALLLVRSGVTSVADSSFSGASLEALLESGIRGTVFQETFGSDPSRDYSEEIERLAERISELRQAAGDRVMIGVSPHSVYTASEPLLRRVIDVSETLTLPIAIHVAESAEETAFIRQAEGPIADYYKSLGYDIRPRGKSPVQYLHDLGLLTPRTIAAHCVQASDADLDILAHEQVKVAHCPKSNAKLDVGVCPFADILARGIVAGIGTDSAVSCDSLDMFEELHFPLLAQRRTGYDAPTVDSRRILQCATIGGATALGTDQEIGTLEPGKRADLIAVDFSSQTRPSPDPYAAIVFSSTASDVLLTMVEGEEIYRDGRFSRIDPDDVRRAASLASLKCSNP